MQLSNFEFIHYQKQFCCVADMLILYTQMVLSRKLKIYLAEVPGNYRANTRFLKCSDTPKHAVGSSDVDMALLYWSIQFK